jgi:hypothetical protein
MVLIDLGGLVFVGSWNPVKCQRTIHAYPFLLREEHPSRRCGQGRRDRADPVGPPVLERHLTTLAMSVTSTFTRRSWREVFDRPALVLAERAAASWSVVAEAMVSEDRPKGGEGI